MTFVNPEFIERYQLLYEKDPKSKVFAPLGEAYRKMGLLDAAFEVCRKGVDLHPHFPSGRVALAKVLIDRNQLEEAIQQLSYAAELSPENLLAHSLLGETWLKLRRPKEALKAFKMVLFLNPQDTKATEAVRKLESLTADEYDDELFAPAQIGHLPPRTAQPPLTARAPVSPARSPSAAPTSPPSEPVVTGRAGSPALVDRMRALERYLSLADAFIVRNDLEKAMDTLKRASRDLGGHPEINSRLDLLLQREQEDLETELAEPLSPMADPHQTARLRKRERLTNLLQRINSRRFDS